MSGEGQKVIRVGSRKSQVSYWKPFLESFIFTEVKN